MGNDGQIVSPQNAYVMTGLLKKTVEMGTLASGSGWGSKFTFRDDDGNRYRIAAAGKTGTTQNWSDAWTVGFTPYYTTAIWFGFDKPGNSLGLSLTGATLVGPIWGDYMHEIHRGLPGRDFIRPSTGVVDVTVCTQSGLLRNASCPSGVTLTFLAGTSPSTRCNVHGGSAMEPTVVLTGMRQQSSMVINETDLLQGFKMPTLDLDFLPPPRSAAVQPVVPEQSPGGSEQGPDTVVVPPVEAVIPPDQEFGLELPTYNPLSD
jgi:penicillin-binding protein 1A